MRHGRCGMTEKKRFDMSFYKNKRVFITGHTGFKGSWLCQLLMLAGAEVTGYALPPITEPALFELLHLSKRMNSIEGDIRNLGQLRKVMDEVKPEIVIHLAAQPLVREGYRNPVYTYETNVMGTVNVLEAIRINAANQGTVKSFLNVTTDKVYKNREWEWGYREHEELDGYDPYSNSKSCSELVTHSYKTSFFDGKESLAISTARAGNVIGGGDFSKDRIIPDCVGAALRGEEIVVRNPLSTRPYQHVLEPLYAYLMIAANQYNDKEFAGYYNVGPNEEDCYKTGDLVALFAQKWGEGVTWRNCVDGGPHEANFLKLDCSKLKGVFDWTPRWNLSMAVEKTVEWSKRYSMGENMERCTDEQIKTFLVCGGCDEEVGQ